MSMIAAAPVITLIDAAFPATRPVRFEPMVNSVPGDEPARIAAAFADKENWTELGPSWLDDVPDGLGTAPSFLSHHAVCF